MNTNTIIPAQLFEYSNNPNIRGNTAINQDVFTEVTYRVEV